jgi:hypothetical protein
MDVPAGVVDVLVNVTVSPVQTVVGVAVKFAFGA